MPLFLQSHGPRSLFPQIVFLGIACGLSIPRVALSQTADVIFHGGDVVTMNDQVPSAEALAVSSGRILAVGSEAEVLKHRGAKTQMVDLQGQTLLPGFLDAHSHYINSLLVANQCKLYAPPSGPGKDVPSIIAELKRFAQERKIPPGDLLVGYGYDDTVMPNGRLLNRDDLDEAFPNNPVRIDHVSMHGAVLNSMALQKYGISAATKTPPGGVIVRKPGTQEPWGLIMETAFLPVVEQSEPLTAQQEIDGSRAGQMLYAEAGVTTAHEGATHFAQYQSMKRASAAGANLIDIVCYPFITDVDKFLTALPVSEWTQYRNRLKVGGVKITLDGSPQGRTAFFTTPYLKGGPGGEENWLGEPTFPQDLANQMVKKVYDLQVPLILHCNGDAAIDAFLEAYELARAGDYQRPWNVTTIHTQFLRKDQIPKFVQYKIRPSFYTLHTYYFAEAHLENRGPEQAHYISPMRDAIDAGLRPTNHTDFVVAPLDQMMMLWSAVNRVSRGGSTVGAGQQVSVYEGLKCMTLWAAEQYGEEQNKGSLEVGKLADLVVLNQNPLKVDPLAIREIKVLATWKEGRVIFPAPAGGHPSIRAATAEADKTYTWRAHACDMSETTSAANREWTLTKLGADSIQIERPPTLKFGKGRVQIFGGINRLSGSYAVGFDSLTIGDLVSTRMAGPPERMELEAKFAKVLRTVDAFELRDNELYLLSQGQIVAELRAPQ